jgi:hypothetical protein
MVDLGGEAREVFRSCGENGVRPRRAINPQVATQFIEMTTLF